MTTFGERLKELRIRKGLTHQEIADYLGVSRSTISYYENGKNEPRIEGLIKLAELLEVSLDYLITGKENESEFLLRSEIYRLESKLEELSIRLKKSIDTEINAFIEVVKKTK